MRRTVDQQAQYEDMASRFVKDIVRHSDALQAGHFVLASGEHSPEKLDCDKIWAAEPMRRVVGELLAYIPTIPQTEIIIGVPHGGRRWAELVHEISGIPLVRLCKLPERGRGVFDFISERDQEIAAEASSATVIEDVVYRGGSAAAARLLLPEACEVDLRAIWNRGSLSTDNAKPFRSTQFLVREALLAYPAQACPDHGSYHE